MLPKIIQDIQINKKNTDNKKVKKELIFNFEKNDFELDNFKKPILSDEKNEKIKQWIKKQFRTYRNRFKIYIGDKNLFGMTYEKYIGQSPYLDLALSEIDREIREILSKHEDILEIREVKVEFENDDLNISFKVITNESNFIFAEVNKWT